MIKSCFACSFYDPDFDCTCPISDLWYLCPMEPDPTDEDLREHGFTVEECYGED